MRLFILLAAIFMGGTMCSPSLSLRGEQLLVELQTGSCFGYCPVIRLSVYTSGRVEYEGKQFAEKQGKASFQLTRRELRRLRQQLKQTDLWRYPDRIASEVVDAPWSTLTAVRRGQTKQVVGTIDRPKPLLDLENLLRTFAEERGYSTRRGVPPNPKE